MTDPIADLLTRIRNAVQARHEDVAVPRSRIKIEIVRSRVNWSWYSFAPACPTRLARSR